MASIDKVKSVVRYATNFATRAIFRDEAVRKLLVEKHYRIVAGKVNAQGQCAMYTAADLLDWRTTMGFRIECSHEVYRANCFYGIGKAMRTFGGANQCVKACVEHGVHFGDYVNAQELDGSGLPCLITFGSARLNHIRSASDVPVAMVGPYIAYAQDYLDQVELAWAKARLGKSLLVFPSHSVDRVKVTYELSSLIKEIERVKAEYELNTVLICLYYRDLLNGAAEAYEQMGYTVVTAGYREDSLFLARQRSLIQIADLTMSNNVGTHVGYCAYMGKPHYIFDQRKRYSSDSSLDDSEFDNEFAVSQAAEKAEVASAFSWFSNDFTPDQRAVLNCYWGFDRVFDHQEMSALLSACETAYQAKTRKRQDVFRKVACAQGVRVDGLHV